MSSTPPSSTKRPPSAGGGSVPRNPASAGSRQLIQPRPHIPWSGDIHQIVPKRVIDVFPKIVAACSGYGWAAVTTGDGYVHVWQPKTVALSDRMERPSHSLRFFVIQLNINESTALGNHSNDHDTIHLALSASGDASRTDSTTGSDASPSDSTTVASSVNLFAYCKGWLVVRKLTTKDVLQSQSGGILKSACPKVRVNLELDEQDVPTEHVTSVTAANNFLVLATSSGNLHWVTLTPVPIGLHVQKISPQPGWLSRIGFRSNAGPSAGVACPSLVLPLSSTQFIALSQDGSSLMHWKVNVTTNTAHHATFEPLSKGSLELDHSQISNPTVLRAALASNHRSMHCIVLGTTSQGEARLYWIQAKLDGTPIRTHWLSRFAAPRSVIVHGVVAAQNGTAYAAFYEASMKSVLVMALVPDNEVIQEVDVPSTHVPSLVPNMLELDRVTHGCSIMATTGVGLRVRYLPHESQPNKKVRFLPSQSNPATVQALVSHLRSSFWWTYQDPETHRPLPPSLLSAAQEDLEQAIVTLATELQHKGDEATAQNPMEWHRALIKFFQERGLYRSLSQLGRWQLLSIGQELAAFGYVVSQRNNNRLFSGGPRAYALAEWCLEVQETDSEAGWDALLAGLLDVAMTFREEMAHPFYDVLTNEAAQPVWLSHHALQQVLLRQLELWQRNPSAMVRPIVESIVKAAFQSYSESHPNKNEYSKVQSLSIKLLRSLESTGDADTVSVDELAFDLCIQYNHFKGLCQISVDHEKKRDAPNFSLDPLFSTIKDVDWDSGYTFAQFVLQWHTDKGLYGHAINYGQHSPTDLAILMDSDERLRQYKWIPNIRQAFYQPATESFLADAKDNTLAETKWALSMAKLTNKLVAAQSKERTGDIDRQLDLVHAQELLEGEESTVPGSNVPLRTPQELVYLALQRLQQVGKTEERVHFTTIALAVCAAMEENELSVGLAAQVWAEALRLDASKWNEWLHSEVDLASSDLRNDILQNTVFGSLLLECRKDETMSLVTYGRHIESSVLDKVGGGANQVEFSRLLRSVTSTADSIQAQSLVVATY